MKILKASRRNIQFSQLCAVVLLLTTGLAFHARGQEGATTIIEEMVPVNKEEGAQETEIGKARAIFADYFQMQLERSPLFQTELGIKTDYGKWDDYSEAFVKETHELNQKFLERLQALDESKLNEHTLLSKKVLAYQLEQKIAMFPWRYHTYHFNQMWGAHSWVVSTLTNEHKIETLRDAKDYIERLDAVPRLFDQLLQAQKISAEKGIIPPDYILAKVIDASENVIRGAPFNKEEAAGVVSDSILFADFKSKIENLEFPAAAEDELVEEARNALEGSVEPAYKKLIAAMRSLQEKADARAGAWSFPDGKDFYQAALNETTTTDLSAKEIHKLGVAEVKRIHKEMRGIMKQVNFKGDLQDFFTFIRNDPQFYFPDTEEGRNAYLDEAVDLVAEIKVRLPELFISQPEIDLVVKRVEPFREKSAGMAFYQAGAPDGSRPGIFYANLSNMREIAKYEMAALVYHEGLPGHHMQISIARELQGLPEFRKYTGFTAYVEGWGLYSELLPKEIGLYKDPYSDFGRLNMELWRACRLVVDTGLHHYKWSREKAIDYLVKNTPTAEARAERSIDRYIVLPSQATAYKVGMLKIVELREKARKALGEKFDIREYHEQVLAAGALPLGILEEQIDSWIASKLSVN